MRNFIGKATNIGVYIAYIMVFSGICFAARVWYVLSTPRTNTVLNELVKTETHRPHPSLKTLALAMEANGFGCNDPYVEQLQPGKGRVEKMTFGSTESREEGFVSFRYFGDKLESSDVFLRP